MIRVIFVTSQITYIPRNYLDLFVEFFKHSQDVKVVGLVLLKNLDTSLLKSVAGLSYLGANKVQRTLLKNIINLPKRSRQNLFEKRGIEVQTFKSMNDKVAIEWCQEKAVDVIVNVRTRCIYKKEILKTPSLGCINIHHGILPKYRGTMCDLYALSENREAGFTIHQMNRKIDDGMIFKTVSVSNGEHKDYIDYLELGAAQEGRELASLLSKISQQEKFPCGTINKTDEKIYTKNPSRKQVKVMKKNGMVL